MRIAFLTPEFITEYADGGGLGNYLHRMTQALRAEDHEPEVFVLSQKRPETIDFRGVLVHRVAPAIRHLAVRVAYRMSRQLGTGHLNHAIGLASGALGLAEALRRREREALFDLIQSADYLAVGLFVGCRRGRPHLIRCSRATDLYAAADGEDTVQRRWETRLELAAIRRRADVAYAPSRLVADHYRRTYGLDLRVLRPPILFEETADVSPPPGLPDRFLFHFGQLIPRKGTAWLAEALPLAWAQEPELTIVCAGPVYNPMDQEGWGSAWGPQRDRVIWLGRLPKPQLYAVLRRAEAAVLPSLVDNLPNTVIESLMFGIPVIGSAGASINELVEPGITGELVHLGDVPALAAALVRLWRGQSPVRKGFRWQAPIVQEMDPVHAVANLLQLAESACSLERVRRQATPRVLDPHPDHSDWTSLSHCRK